VVAAHYKKDDMLNCWTSSSGISGHHADFHEGHGTVGAWQGNGMGAAWAWHAMCESASIVLYPPVFRFNHLTVFHYFPVFWFSIEPIRTSFPETVLITILSIP